MSEKTLVSVIIPTYNRAELIEKSVRSVMQQTYENLEIIVVDDASTDNTAEVIRCLIEEDSRIRYVVNTSAKHGPSAARNCGIMEAIGSYIAFNDSDDVFCKDKIECQLANLIKEDSDVDFCIKKKGNALSPWQGFDKKDITLETILCKCFSGTQSLLGKTEVFRLEQFDEKMNCNEDWELLIRLTEKYRLSYTNKVLVNVDDTEGSVGSSAQRGLAMMEYILGKHDVLYSKYPRSKKKMNAQIRYAKSVALDEEKHSLLTKAKRYMALINVMR